MPKIRRKYYTKGFTTIDNNLSPYKLTKTGICSESIKKIASKKYQTSFSYFLPEKIHSNLKIESNINHFDDNNTINLLDKDVIAGLGIESSYFSENSKFSNKVIGTPSTFSNLEDNQIISLTSAGTSKNYFSVYDKVLYPNYIEESAISPFTDNTENVESSFEEIDMEFKIQTKIQFSFNKLENREALYADYYTLNSNTAYFYRPDLLEDEKYIDSKIYKSSCDYIGNMCKNYYSSKTNFLDSSICFNNINKEDAQRSGGFVDQTVCNVISPLTPIDTFGFPYDLKYKSKDRHRIKASNYINKPFLIEEVEIQTTATNISRSQSANHNCVNFFDFFMLCERGEVNSNNTNISSREVNYRYKSGVDTKGVNIIESESITRNFIGAEDDRFYSDSTYDSSTQQISRAISQSSLNENTCEDFASSATFDEPTSRNPIREIVFVARHANTDTFYENYAAKVSDNVKSSKVSLECIYEDELITIKAKPRTYSSNYSITSFPPYEIYSEKSISGRTNLDINLDRSEKNENQVKNELIKSVQDKSNITVDLMCDDQTEDYNGFVILPTDSLIFGGSFTPDMLASSSISSTPFNQISHDFFFITSNIKLKIRGRYLINDEKSKIKKNKEVSLYNSRNYGLLSSSVIDEVSNTSIILSPNSYINKLNEGLAGSTINSLNLDLFESTFSQTLFIPNTNATKKDNIYLSEVLLDKAYQAYKKQYYNIGKFGLPSNKIMGSAYTRYTELNKTNTIQEVISKVFRKGLFKKKSPAKVSSYIDLDFTKMTDFIGTNYIDEVLFARSSGYQNITGLYVSLKDNIGFNLSFFFRLSTDSSFDTIYSSENRSFTITDGFSEDGTDEHVIIGFINSTIYNSFNYNDTTNSFGSNYEYNKILIAESIIDKINEVNSHDDYYQYLSLRKKFNINIEAKIVDSGKDNVIRIGFELTKKGSVNDSKLLASLDDSLYSQFSVEEGDLINSYNVSSNAYYNNNDLIYQES